MFLIYIQFGVISLYWAVESVIVHMCAHGDNTCVIELSYTSSFASSKSLSCLFDCFPSSRELGFAYIYISLYICHCIQNKYMNETCNYVLARCVLVSFKSTTVNFMINSCNECHHETVYFKTVYMPLSVAYYLLYHILTSSSWWTWTSIGN